MLSRSIISRITSRVSHTQGAYSPYISHKVGTSTITNPRTSLSTMSKFSAEKEEIMKDVHNIEKVENIVDTLRSQSPLGWDFAQPLEFTSVDQFDRPEFEWNPESKKVFQELIDDDFKPMLFSPSSGNFTAGGPNPEKRILYQFFFRPGSGYGSMQTHPSVKLDPRHPSKMIDGQLEEGDFVNPLGDCSGVFYFGPQTVGPTKTVHGGAIATAADTIMGMCVTYCGMNRVTAKLEINYRSLCQVNTFAYGRARVHHRVGRKAVVLFDFRSLDGKTIYSEGWALFISPKPVVEE